MCHWRNVVHPTIRRKRTAPARAGASLPCVVEIPPEKERGGLWAAPKVAEKRFPGGIPMTMPSATRSVMLQCNISIFFFRMQEKI